MGADVRSNTNPIYVALASHHLLPWMAFRVDRNYCDFRADLLAFVGSLQHRSTLVGYLGVCELASSFPITTSCDVCLLSQRGFATRRYAQPEFCRHDALHVYRDCLYGLHVCLARHDPVASKVPLRRLMGVGSFTQRKSALNGALFLSYFNCIKQSGLVAHYSSYLKQS